VYIMVIDFKEVYDNGVVGPCFSFATSVCW